MWSTAALSVARAGLAATSLPNDGLAFFAGGQGGVLLTLLLLLIADVLRSKRLLQYCRHLQCEERCVDHCCPQRRPIKSCSHIAAE